VLALAAGLAGQGAVLASASTSTGHKDGRARPIVDPITSTVYVDLGSARRVGASSLGLTKTRSSPSVPFALVGISTSAIACGAFCHRLVSEHLTQEVNGAKERKQVPTSSPRRPPPPSDLAGDTEPWPAEGLRGPALHLKVGVAMLVGITASMALRWAMRPRPARTARGTLRGVAARRGVEAARIVEVTAKARSPPKARYDDDVMNESSELEEAFSRRAGGLGQGTHEKELDLESEDTESLVDEPLIQTLQPGNKGYVRKRKSDYEEKAEEIGRSSITRQLSNGSGPHVLKRETSSGSTRQTEFHRIMTEPQDSMDPQSSKEEEVDDELDRVDFMQPTASSGSAQPAFFRISTEG